MIYQRARSPNWYVKRTLPGLGVVRRSLGTQFRPLAEQREKLIADLHGRNRIDLLEAWLEGRVTLQQIEDAMAGKGLDALTEQLDAPGADVALADAIEAALAFRAGDVAPGTLQRYRDGLTHFQRFCSDRDRPITLALDALDLEVIQKFKAHRLEERARQTVNKDLQGVSVLISYAVHKGWLEKRIELPRFKPTARVTYLEPDEARRYLDVIDQQYRLLMETLIGTGLRLGEAERLTVSAIRFRRAKVAMPEESVEGARLEIRESKTREGVRTPFVPKWLARKLDAHIEANGLSGGARLFPFKRRTVQKAHGRAAAAVGREGYTIHDHRHTAAVLLARSGMKLQLLQEQLGHREISMTMKYAKFHPTYGDVAEHMDQVGRQLEDGPGTQSGAHSGNGGGLKSA